MNEEGEGPTNIECWNLRNMNLNLIRMLKEDGMTNNQIARIHRESEQKYTDGVKKTLCRILAKQEDDMNILPPFIDRWKMFAKHRKIWKRVLRDCEIRLNRHPDESAKLWAFRRLQYSHSDREKSLMKQPIADLRKQVV